MTTERKALKPSVLASVARHTMAVAEQYDMAETAVLAGTARAVVVISAEDAAALAEELMRHRAERGIEEEPPPLWTAT